MPAIDGSRILVAGGAHRVGRALALDLAGAGADVFVSYHTSVAPAETTRADIEALGRRSGVVRANAADPADMTAMVDAAADALGGLDVYVHCPSGGFEPRAAEDVDEILWDTAMDSTAKGFMFAAQAAHRVMAAQGAGVIVAITDVAGIQPWPKFAPHGAAKAAQIHLLKCLALAWGRDGVRVCGVAPGPVLMPEGIAGNPDETALGRLGAPADVAQAVRYCIEADFVTGQNVVVDGGRLLRP
ncbi:MAG TPA: SDR family oxidoreductase [Gaiellales bacterium]|nr:SDR family oxidoreductase [Gaiellales bacterium]